MAETTFYVEDYHVGTLGGFGIATLMELPVEEARRKWEIYADLSKLRRAKRDAELDEESNNRLRGLEIRYDAITGPKTRILVTERHYSIGEFLDELPPGFKRQ